MSGLCCPSHQCTHFRCYEMALEHGATFVDDNGDSIHFLVRNGKYKILGLIWQCLQKRGDPNLHYFSLCLWRHLYDACIDNPFGYQKIVSMAHEQGILRVAYERRYDELDLLLPPLHCEFDVHVELCIKRAITHKFIEVVKILAEYIC